ncbi:MAG: hypothetical protein CM1200mP35_01600 [Chloroflexota bacterium]|nr:MAG: hypothetical protein CM1200mP35_01600 [Chloroflexota bacterium]
MPFFDGMTVYVIEDAARRLASLSTLQGMGWLVMGGTTLKDMMQVQGDSDGKMRAYASGPGSMRGFWMHLNKPPFDEYVYAGPYTLRSTGKPFDRFLTMVRG